jgi:hypothetical protein
MSHELYDFICGPGVLVFVSSITGSAGHTCRVRRRRASIIVLQCDAVAVDYEDDNEDGDDDDDNDDGQAIHPSTACRAREYDDWMCHTGEL